MLLILWCHLSLRSITRYRLPRVPPLPCDRLIIESQQLASCLCHAQPIISAGPSSKSCPQILAVNQNICRQTFVSKYPAFIGPQALTFIKPTREKREENSFVFNLSERKRKSLRAIIVRLSFLSICGVCLALHGSAHSAEQPQDICDFMPAILGFSCCFFRT